MKCVVVTLLLLSGCHVYDENYACRPTENNPRGGVTKRWCAWVYEDEDAGAEE